MPDQAPESVTSDRSDIVYRYAPQLFRLALIVSGDPSVAATRVEQSFRTLPAAGEPEAALMRGLLPKRTRRVAWRMHADADAVARAGATPDQAATLLHVLARATPAHRLAIGLNVLRGMSPASIAELLGDAVPDPAAVITQFRLDVAAALGLLPADADRSLGIDIDRWLDGQLNDQQSTALRRMLLEDEDARTLRGIVQTTRQLVGQLLPSLFAATPPADMLARLAERMTAPVVPTAPRTRMLKPSLLLGAGVLLLVGLIIFVPELLARRTPTAAPVLAPAAVLDAAIHRFDRAPLAEGVTNERYRVQLGRQTMMFERLYEYNAPHRMLLQVRPNDEKQPARAAVSTNGQSLVQYRLSQSRFGGASATDVQVSPQEAQTMLPVLRGFFSPKELVGGDPFKIDVSGLYLNQARANNATSLGQTTFLNRPAYLLSYQSDALPPTRGTSASGPVQVLLTIDRASYALLDVAVVPLGQAESTTSHPWQALAFDIAESTPDTAFVLPNTGSVVTRTGESTGESAGVPQGWTVSLAQAQRDSDLPLLVPAQLPDEAMRGLAVRFGGPQGMRNVGLLYQGEFQTLLLLSKQASPRNDLQLGEAQQAGDFSYRLAQNDRSATVSIAQVFRPDAAGRSLEVLLLDVASTQAEREATIKSIIASLTPVTAQNLENIQGRFAPDGPG